MIYKDQTHKSSARLPVSLSGIELKAIEVAAETMGINRCAFIKLAVRRLMNDMVNEVTLF